MSNILVVIGSARKGRVADTILGYVLSDIAKRTDVTVTVADLAQINLPFFDNENSPLSPYYVITNPQVAAWNELVTAADGIVFITPEYNHSLTAIEKNAIDSIGSEWAGKPTTAVAYGWSGGSLAVADLRAILDFLKADHKHNMAQLAFMKDINVDGTLIDEASVSAQIATAIDELV